MYIVLDRVFICISC